MTLLGRELRSGSCWCKYSDVAGEEVSEDVEGGLVAVGADSEAGVQKWHGVVIDVQTTQHRSRGPERGTTRVFRSAVVAG